MNLLLGGVMTAYWMQPDLGDGNLLFLFKFDDDNSSNWWQYQPSFALNAGSVLW